MRLGLGIVALFVLVAGLSLVLAPVSALPFISGLAFAGVFLVRDVASWCVKNNTTRFSNLLLISLFFLSIWVLIGSGESDAQSGLTWSKTEIDAVVSTSATKVDHAQINNTLMACEKHANGIRFYKSSDLGASWSAPVAITTASDTNYCSIAVTTENHAVIAFQDNTGTASSKRLQVARTSNGGTSWITVTPDVASSNQARGTSPSIAYATTTSVIMASVAEGAAAGSEIRYCSSADRGATWGCGAISDTVQCDLDSAVTRNDGGLEIFAESASSYVITANCGSLDGTQARNGAIARYRSTNSGTTWSHTGNRSCEPEESVPIVPEPYACEVWLDTGGFINLADVQYAVTARNSDGPDQEEIPPVNSHHEELWLWSATGGGNWSKLGNAYFSTCEGCSVLSSGDVKIASTGEDSILILRASFGRAADDENDLEYTYSTNGGLTFGPTEEIDSVTPITAIAWQKGLSVIGLDDNTFSVFSATGSGHFHYLSTEASVGNFTYCCFTDARDVRTDFEFEPSVFVRDQGVETIVRLRENLTETSEADACPNGGTSPDTIYGLAVSIEPRVFTVCQPANYAIQQLTNNLGGINQYNFGSNRPTVLDAFNRRAVRGISDQGPTAQFPFRAQSWDMDTLNIVWSDSVGTTTGNFPDGLGTDYWNHPQFGNRTVVVEGTFGTKVYNNIGTIMVSDSGVDGTSADIHNGTIIIGSSTGVRKYVVQGGTLFLQDTNGAINVKAGGLRFSKDGRYIVAPHQTSGVVYVLDNSTLDIVFTAAGLINMRAADMDVLNNHLYVLTKTTLVQFNIWTNTTGIGGDGGSDPNPPPDESPLPDPPPPPAECTVNCDGGGGNDPGGVPPGPGDAFDEPNVIIPTEGLEDLLGSENRVRWFVAILLILGIMGAFWVFTESVTITAAGFPVGFFLAYGLGFISTWVIVVIFAVIVFLIIGRLRGVV